MAIMTERYFSFKKEKKIWNFNYAPCVILTFSCESRIIYTKIKEIRCKANEIFRILQVSWLQNFITFSVNIAFYRANFILYGYFFFLTLKCENVVASDSPLKAIITLSLALH